MASNLKTSIASAQAQAAAPAPTSVSRRLVTHIGAAMGQTPAQIDALFTLAASL